MVDNSLQGIVKYSVVLLDAGTLAHLPDEPDPNWSKIETMAYDGEIDRIFKGFRDRFGRGELTGITKFRLGEFENLWVYFNPADKKSLTIVAWKGEEAVKYIKTLGLRIPVTLIQARSDYRW